VAAWCRPTERDTLALQAERWALKAAFNRLRARAITTVLLGCALRRSAAAALTDGFGRIHAGGDGRRTGREAVAMVPAISDRASCMSAIRVHRSRFSPGAKILPVV